MKIKDVVFSSGRTGFFFDDQKAIKTTAVADGAAYMGNPVTPGFTKVRQAGESISVLFVLEDGQIAYGDCAAVQYSGAGGRDPLFLAKDFIPIMQKEVVPLYKGKDITTFKEMANIVDAEPFHTAIRYGVTQACLDAVAKLNKKLMAQIVAQEYNLTVSEALIPIFSQSGDDRYNNVDKMILKSSDILPHGLINNITKLGVHGEALLEYVQWLSKRITQLSPNLTYQPILHLDVYGVIGIAFNHDVDAMVNYLAKIEQAAKPFTVRIEGPVDMGELHAQVDALANITKKLDERGIHVEIVADEWCNTFEDIKLFTDNKAGHMAQIKTPDLGGINNTIEAVLYCKEHGMGAYQGGTCNETDRSAVVCTHAAMATKPKQILAKPGMGVDEGYMIVYNEMNRILALKDIL